jgi:hypothetical protein
LCRFQRCRQPKQQPLQHHEDDGHLAAAPYDIEDSQDIDILLYLLQAEASGRESISSALGVATSMGSGSFDAESDTASNLPADSLARHFFHFSASSS